MYSFKIIPPDSINSILPLVYSLNEQRIDFNVLEERFKEMASQNYECAVIEFENDLVGVAGLWYCTRHYVGKSAELDHVYIHEDHRGKGLGNKFMGWIEEYLRLKGVKSIELNTYVNNYPSHKFYYNQGFDILGYHFLKKI